MPVCTVNAVRHFFLVYFMHVLTVSSKNQLFTDFAQVKSKVGLALAKEATLRVTLDSRSSPRDWSQSECLVASVARAGVLHK